MMAGMDYLCLSLTKLSTDLHRFSMEELKAKSSDQSPVHHASMTWTVACCLKGTLSLLEYL